MIKITAEMIVDETNDKIQNFIDKYGKYNFSIVMEFNKWTMYETTGPLPNMSVNLEDNAKNIPCLKVTKIEELKKLYEREN